MAAAISRRAIDESMRSAARANCVMPRPAAHPTTFLSLAAIAAAVAVALALAAPSAGVASAAGAQAPCGAATAAAYLNTAVAVARQINAGESASAGVTRAVATIESDQVLATAVAADDLPAVESEVHALVFNHEHIVRLRVLRDGQTLDDLGGPLVLAPVSGPLTLDGRIVGSFVMSVQDDSGYERLLERLVGADGVMRYEGQTVLSDIDAASLPLADRGTVVVAGVSYLVATFGVSRFPSGELSVSLLLAAPAAAVRSESCAGVSAGVLADVAQRVYGEAATSPWWVGTALAALARTTTLASALASGDDSALAQTADGLVAGGGFEALDVVAGGRVVAAAGNLVASIAPVSRALIDSAGRVVGQAVFAVETAQGYVGLVHAFTGAPVLVRAGTRQLAGTFAGPALLPQSGLTTYLGTRYAVASFAAVQFPQVPARVYVLAPEGRDSAGG
jgi:hypothetical protein